MRSGWDTAKNVCFQFFFFTGEMNDVERNQESFFLFQFAGERNQEKGNFVPAPSLLQLRKAPPPLPTQEQEEEEFIPHMCLGMEFD